MWWGTASNLLGGVLLPTSLRLLQRDNEWTMYASGSPIEDEGPRMLNLRAEDGIFNIIIIIIININIIIIIIIMDIEQRTKRESQASWNPNE
jgi:hypothetical protein